MTTKSFRLPLFLSVGFFILGVLTLSDYGINWDAPFRMMRGHTYAHFFLTGRLSGDSSFVHPIPIAPGEFLSRYGFSEWEGIRPGVGSNQSSKWNGNYFLNNDEGHPPLPDILGALSNTLFYQRLHIFSYISSYHIPYVFISALGVFVVTAFVFDVTGLRFGAIIAGLSLALFPQFFAESHFNMKDPLQASLFAGAVWSCYRWVKSKKLRWLITFSVFVSLALGIKWNILSLLLIVPLWFCRMRHYISFKHIFFCCFIILLIFFSTWPYLWVHPIERIGGVIKLYIDLGFRPTTTQPLGFLLPLGFNSYPWVLLFSQIPEIILVLAAVGIYVLFKRDRDDRMKSGSLMALWFLIPMIRQSLPGIWFYSGIRQVAEVFPALAVLSGVGAAVSVKCAGAYRRVVQITLFIAYILLAGQLVRLHPNENAYFNTLVGGLRGAVKHGFVDWTLTYGNIYRQGVVWLNQHTEKDARVAFLNGSMFAISPLWLRPDMSISPRHFSGLAQSGEYVMMLYDPGDQHIFAKRYIEQLLRPIHQVLVGGIPLLTIYKNDPDYSLIDMSKEESISSPGIAQYASDRGRYFSTDLSRTVRLTRITIKKRSQEQCASVNAPFIDEFIELDHHISYGLQEHREMGDSIEYDFAAEPTQTIRIFPQSDASCFLHGSVASIHFLPE